METNNKKIRKDRMEKLYRQLDERNKIFEKNHNKKEKKKEQHDIER